MSSSKTKEDLLNDEDFKKLVRQKNTISWILTSLELVLYFWFIALIAFNKPFLAQKLNAATKTTVGIPIAESCSLIAARASGVSKRA